MEDIVHIRLLFVAGLVVVAGVMVLLAYAIARAGDWLRACAGRARPAGVTHGTVKSVPVRGTR